MDSLFRKICEEFALKGEYVGYEIIKSGNINDTYVIDLKKEDGSEKQYIVQRVNTRVFKNPDQIVRNAELVTSHIMRKLKEQRDPELKRKVVHIYRTVRG
ncbi:MAG TPA: mucin desulfatase, partial [Clostridiales bacterium]|nr:mucin desulfatase [Clostridiales bacterium]